MVAPPQVVQKPSCDSFQVPSPLAPVPIGWRFILPLAVNVILNFRFDCVDAVNGWPLKHVDWMSFGASLSAAVRPLAVSGTTNAAAATPRANIAIIASPRFRLRLCDQDTLFVPFRPQKNLNVPVRDRRCSAACRSRTPRGSTC